MILLSGRAGMVFSQADIQSNKRPEEDGTGKLVLLSPQESLSAKLARFSRKKDLYLYRPYEGIDESKHISGR
jgi:hypothetical protein